MIRDLNGTLPSLEAMRKKFDEEVARKTEKFARQGLEFDQNAEKEYLPEKVKFAKIRKALDKKQ